jgi:hypothetical protein
MKGFIARRGLPFLALSMLVVAGAGCGEATGVVSGEVKVGGEPVPRGTITFIPQGPKAKGRLTDINEGKYSLAGLPVGEYAVTVQALVQPPPPTTKGGKAGTKAKGPATKGVHVPAKYADPEKSGLTCTIKSGENKYDPPLEPEEPAPPKK